MSLGSNKHHHVDYIELIVSDMEESKAFFSNLLDWKFTDYSPGYVGVNQKDGGEVGGLTTSGTVSGSGPLVIFFSEKLEESMEAVKKAGGTISKEIFDFPGGRRFHFKDPSGNEFAIWAR